MATLREIREGCVERNLESKPINDRIRHHIAAGFTWVLVRTPVTANMVTGMFIFFGAIGGALLALPGYWIPLVGAICIQVHAVLDIADGQVARYRRMTGILTGNPKVGMYLDLVGHVIADTMIFLGLTMAFFDSVLPNPYILIPGFLGIGARLLYLLIGCIVHYSVANESPNDSAFRIAEMPNLKALKGDLTSPGTSHGAFEGAKRLIIAAFAVVRWPHYLDFILILALVGHVAWAFPVLTLGMIVFTGATVYVVAHHRILQCDPGKEGEAMRGRAHVEVQGSTQKDLTG